MTQIIFQNNAYKVAKGDDVLTTLLNTGVDVPHACRSGICQSCLMKVTEGTAPVNSQKGLKDTLKAQSYVLACQCHPDESLTLEFPSVVTTRYKSHVLSKQQLSHNVIQIKLKRPKNFNFRAGQFVTLWKDATLARCYSIASTPDDNELEFHIREIPQGQFSGWAANEAMENTAIEIQEPSGSCFYIEGSPGAELVLIGTGTGLAPLQGILLEAIKAGHKGRIDLFHGALNPDGLYNTDLLMSLADKHENVFYHACVLDKGDEQNNDIDYLEGNISELVFEKISSMAGKKVYLCGDPDLVNLLQTKTFLAGANSQDIYIDAFAFSNTTPKPCN
ncbi:MAG: 2Fe-2S iron-sulfur cluster binding domain-containing protein [Gammaproteobacteria bacterium]|nr:2Fe-2S iron-sulfur cluster binding domain-containing protein [Gammaproteobacteria bacterium]